MKKMTYRTQHLLLGLATSVLITSAGWATPQKSLEARGIHTDPATASEMVKKPEMIHEYKTQIQAHGLTPKEYTDLKKANPGAPAGNLVLLHGVGGGAGAGAALVHLQTDPGRHLAGAIPAPTPTQLRAAASLLALPWNDFNRAQLDAAEQIMTGAARIAAPTKNEVKAAVELIGAAHGLTAVADPSLAQVKAAERLRAIAGLRAGYADPELNATVDIMSAGHANIPAPTQDQIEDAVRLIAGVAGRAAIPHPSVHQLTAYRALRAAGVGDANITDAGNHLVDGVDILQNGKAGEQAAILAQYAAAVQAAWAHRPEGIAKVENLNGGDPIYEIVWIRNGQALGGNAGRFQAPGQAVGGKFTVERGNPGAPGVVGEYWIFSALADGNPNFINMTHGAHH